VNTKEGSAVDDDSYLGYSVAVGNFGDAGGSGAAVGMPRGAGLLGKVLFSSFFLNGLKLVHLLVACSQEYIKQCIESIFLSLHC
jgi:hypothetical protein